MSEWTTETPTEAGYYWYWQSDIGRLRHYHITQYYPDRPLFVWSEDKFVTDMPGLWWRIPEPTPPTEGAQESEHE